MKCIANLIAKGSAVSGPAISIVVTCYNKRETIADCVESVLEQNFRDYELIIVDDGSTDGSDLIINQLCKDPRVKIIRMSHRGISAAKNHGMKNATGEITLFLDGDCILNQNSLVELLSSINNAGADCVGGEVRAINDRSIIAKTIELMQNEVERKWPFGANVAYRREVLEKVGRFDERMERGEDAELFLRVRKLSFKCTINSGVSAKTLNPDSPLKLFEQRFRWGMGFAQLTERHRETLTKRIKFCFILTPLVMFSPFLTLVDGRLIIIFLILLTLDHARYFPQAMEMARKTGKKRCCALIPSLRVINSVAYFLGWTYWKILELTGKRSKLEAFSPESF